MPLPHVHAAGISAARKTCIGTGSDCPCGIWTRIQRGASPERGLELPT